MAALFRTFDMQYSKKHTVFILVELTKISYAKNNMCKPYDMFDETDS